MFQVPIFIPFCLLRDASPGNTPPPPGDPSGGVVYLRIVLSPEQAPRLWMFLKFLKIFDISGALTSKFNAIQASFQQLFSNINTKSFWKTNILLSYPTVPIFKVLASSAVIVTGLSWFAEHLQADGGTLPSLTLILLMWIIEWAPNNAIKWQMGSNSQLKG